MKNLLRLPDTQKCAIIALFISLVFADVLTAQIVTVGSGGYTMQLPPADAAGRNRPPNGTPRVSGQAQGKPIPTADWWTGLLTANDAILYNYPLSMRSMSTGLIMSFTFLGQGANDTRQPMGPEQPIVLGVQGLTGTFPTISQHTDWTVTASWNQSNRNFNATMGLGMPFVYCTKGSSDVASVVVNTGTVSIQSEMLLITNSIQNSNFAVYAPVGSTWVQAGNTYTSTLAGKNYFSAALLPPGTAAQTAANAYKQHAYVFPENTEVSWQYNEATAVLQSTYTVTPDVKEGSGTTVLMGLLPHQWDHLSATSAQPGTTTYATVRGTMKVLSGNSFVVENTFKGILSALPNEGRFSTGFNPAALKTKIDLVKNVQLSTWTDSYNEGLMMNQLVQVAKIADQMGDTAARNEMMQTVKTRLQNWLHAAPGENAFVFHYNDTWKTLIGYPSGHSSDANLNDHHFHYGYFIAAAAAIEQFEPGWATQWGPMVELLIKDANSPDRNSNLFPFLRHFSPYAGHAWASGLLNNDPHGNNQESSSESMNYNAALIHWGQLTGNTQLRDLGIYLYTTEQTAIEEYWFDMSNRNYPANYAHLMASRVWGNGHDRNTFWTADIAAMYGINMFPTTGSSLYLGHNKPYAASLWNEMTTKTGVLSNVTNDNLWYETFWSYLAFTNPAQALTLYNNHPNYKPKFGNTDAHAYHWLHSMNGMGTVEASITANYPIAAVFSKNGQKTYVAHNYGAAPITVLFSDGYSMQVPGRTLKTSNDADIEAVLTASDTQVAANSTITLSAAITGTGVSKVEFYEGTNLLHTVNAPPFTYTTAPLAARVHGFYAKIYAGTAMELSNVVSAVVGSQLPYQGQAAAIPTQSIQAGHYDYYEGGLGQGIAYFDATTSNEAGNFRSPEYVDAGPVGAEGNMVGWIEKGEWLEYTVDIEQAGAYDLAIRYTSGNSGGGGPFKLLVDGQPVTNDITVNFTNAAWSVWATKTVPGILLPAGRHVLRLAFDGGGFNIGRMTFTYKGSGAPSLQLSAEAVSMDAFAGSTQTLGVLANVSWTVQSNQPWLTVAPASGFGDGNVTLTAQDNPDAAPRAATLTFTGNGVPARQVTVTQNAGGVPYLRLSQAQLNFFFAANAAQKVKVVANVAWTAESSAPWLTVSPATGNGVQELTINAADNNQNNGRTATITLTANEVPVQTIQVTQNGAPISISLPINFELDGTYVFTNFDGGNGAVVLNPVPDAGNPSNKVARIIRNGGAAWAGSLLTLNHTLSFATQPIISMKVFSPRAGMPVLLKLEGNTGPSEVTATTTVANNWETLHWNFTGRPSGVYNKLVFMFDFGSVGNGSMGSTFFFDDVAQVAQPATFHWTGNADTAWENPANWSLNAVPGATSMVIIPAGRPRYPTVNSSTVVKSLLCIGGTSVTLAPGVVLQFQ